MMSKKLGEYSEITHILQELHKKYPSYNMGRHLSTALDEYTDLWGVSDKEILFALNKYAAELDLNIVADDSSFLKRVIEDADHLFDVVDPLEMDDFSLE